MTKSFQMYPTGIAGIALLLLRIDLALSLYPMMALSEASWSAICSCIIALALLLGIFNGVAAGAAACLFALLVLTSGLSIKLPLFLNVMTAIVACMLGPGGFSADARLFGHRVIRLNR